MRKIYITLKISALFLLTTLLINTTALAQEEVATDTTVQEKPQERPVRPAFENGLLFDAATTTLLPSKSLEFVIQHRFGTINTEDQTWDFFGIWAPSNIRLGLNYSILDNFTVGIGTTKFKKMEDIQLKYRIIEQTRSNSIPVTVMVYEVVGIDGRPESTWQENYKFSNRISYFTQVVVSRRFNDKFSLQFAPGFTHYNSLDSIYDHDRISLSFAGRYKLTPQTSFIFSADFPLQIQGISELSKEYNDNAEQPKPNVCIGFEISTSTHAFHIYAGTAQGILPQEDIMWNQNEFFKGQILIGLNITRLWNF
jgi:hypothetical protein